MTNDHDIDHNNLSKYLKLSDHRLLDLRKFKIIDRKFEFVMLFLKSSIISSNCDQLCSIF